MAIYANLSIDQGSDFASTVGVVAANGLVFDLTGYTARGQIRKNYKSTTYTAFSCSIPSPTGGTINIALTAAQTGLLKSGRYLYDLEIVKTSDGTVTRVVEGQVEVSPRVTKV